MVRDVLIASMNKGQFPLALFGMILIVLIIRMPPQDVSALAFRIVEDLKAGYLAGYAVSAGAFGGWFVHARIQRRVIADELERIARLRTELQKRELGSRVKSSNRKR